MARGSVSTGSRGDAVKVKTAAMWVSLESTDNATHTEVAGGKQYQYPNDLSRHGRTPQEG